MMTETETETEAADDTATVPTVFVVFFGNDKRWVDLLTRWRETYKRSGCPWPVYVLTDLETKLEWTACAKFCPWVHYKVIRPGNDFDRKSALICAALPFLPARSVVVDVDAFFLQDPSEMLAPYLDLPFAMGEDAGRRGITVKGIGTVPEHSSSVMVFGDPECRRSLVAEYVQAWEELIDAPGESRLEVDIREQRAWSVVKHRTGAPLLPRELNDSRFWGGPTAATCIYHAHGREKWNEQLRGVWMPD